MIVTGSSVNESAANADYLGIFEDDHDNSADFSEANVIFGPTPRAGTVRNLFAQINSAPGAGGTWTITVHTGLQAGGGVTTTPTVVTCSITGASATTCNSAALNAAVPAGSFVTVRVTRSPTSGTGTPSSKQWRFSFEY